MLRPTFSRMSTDDAAALLGGGLVGLNVHQMERAGPQRPKVSDWIKSGALRYSRDDPDEHWQSYKDIAELIERDGMAEGDCEDLATLVAAEMRVSGEDPLAKPVIYKSGRKTYHVIVSSPRYGLLDPSIAGGM